MGVSSDMLGNLYIGFMNDHRVRKVDSFGIITTIAGIGTPGYSGDDGTATSAQLNGPQYVTINTSGDILISCSVSYHIRIVQNPTSLNEIEKDISFLNIFPNPSTGEIHLNGQEDGIYFLSDALGRIKNEIVLSKENNFSETVSGLENGVYFLNGKNTKQKVVVLN